MKIYYPEVMWSLLLYLENTSAVSKPQIQSLAEAKIPWYIRVIGKIYNGSTLKIFGHPDTPFNSAVLFLRRVSRNE